HELRLACGGEHRHPHARQVHPGFLAVRDLRFLESLPQAERLRLCCDAGFHKAPPVESVLPPTAHSGSCARPMPRWRGRTRTATVGYRVRLQVLTSEAAMTTRPRLTRPPRVLIASDQNHALWDVEGTLGRQGYSVLRVFAGTAEAERAPKRSMVDELTGLYTRRGLARRAWELILQTAHHNTSVACVVVAPEVRGEAGAGVLRDVARLVRSTARHSDAVGRVGLTEFAVIAPGANRIGARRLAQRLQGAAHASGNGGGTGEVAVGLRAGYDALRQLRTAAIEPRRLLGRAARALEMARAEGK